MMTSPPREANSDAAQLNQAFTVADAPLSAVQRRVWLLGHLRPELVEYNMTQTFELSGPLDTAAFDAAFQLVVERHSILRSRVVEDAAEGPLLRAEPASTIQLQQTDLRHMAVGSAFEEAHRLDDLDVNRPFDLANGPWMRARLTELPAHQYLFTVVVHHIAVDAASMQILWSELSKAYAAFLAESRPDLPPLPMQFGDYANLMSRQLDSPEMAGEVEHWRRRLAGASETELRTDHPRPAVRGGKGQRLSHTVDPAVADGVRELSRKHHVTPFMVLLAAFNALVARHSGSRDVTVGVPMSGRTLPETEALIGFFVNTVALRTDLSGNPTFAELLSRVRATALDAYEHQAAPFDLLVDELRPERDLSRNPLFQLMFNQVEEQSSWLSLPGVSVRPLQSQTDQARFDLEVTVVTRGQQIEVLICYATELFEAKTIGRFGEQYQQLLAEVVRRPETRVGDLDVLTPEEKRLLLAEQSVSTRLEPMRFVHDLIDEQASCTPDAIALCGPDGAELTYAQLAERSSALAATLRTAGADQRAPVAVLVERSPDMVVALLAVHKAGAAYLPLEPTYPRDRLILMLADSGAELLVGRRTHADSLGLSANVRVIDVGQRLPSDAAHELTPAAPLAMDDVAYHIYTSGSTGRPKGVMVTHRGLANFVLDTARRLETSDKDVYCSITTIAFDISVLELFVPLSRGARVVVVDQATASDGAALARVLASSAVTVLGATPATWHMLLLSGWVGNKLQAVSGGEAMSPQLAAALAPKVFRLWNFYGPTETTAYASLQRVVLQEGTDPVPIGRPIANTKMYVVDSELRLMPVGAVGELLIGGAGVTRGYAGRPGLTAERFVPDPFGTGERLYRTGDLARWRHDGTLEYVGREDTQVKVRGYRIELGEIEAVLQRYPSVARGAVTTVGDGLEIRIVGYVSWRDQPDEAGLHRFLRDRLPQYMVPADLVTVDEMPLSSNGKVDRKRLPKPDRSTSTESVAPRDALELRVTSICERVLGRSPIGVHDDFFAAGGNSLNAFELVEAVRRELGASVPLSMFFRTPTIEGLCAALPDVSAVADELLVPLATGPGETDTPLFLIHPGGGGVSSYIHLGRELEGKLTVYGIESVGYNTDETPLSTVEEMAQRYLAEIETVQPLGPRVLAGWSFGGLVALEMAGQLERAGRPVTALILLDAPTPGGTGPADDEDVLSRLGTEAGLPTDEVESLDDDELIAALVRHSHQVGKLPARVESTAIRRMVAVARANIAAASRYRPEAVVTADIHLLTVSESHPTLNSPDVNPAVWNTFTHSEVHLVPVSGNHHDMVHPPYAGELAAQIAKISQTIDEREKVGEPGIDH
ncbi:amino acid adenylation domain-containing protein [Streptomyces sp. NPDC090080]|uniref:non-ribosomal peptide synthetase n=1 Tax=Streptomyces sp. NPDC090080 TaxID=3365939 RepID=UPI003806D83E